ncbi:prepilin-type N-terminal cleavage/methylation domain-containing protein [Thiothrix subterranea]|uniref:PilW family protein n=1 Tax=Thiothrix subterranea TaxID=2735563 RepID=UPI00192BF0A0|nr:PilW family protein [Thiothrix subterranea]QQZ30108.1 prepilin-type N-terminal cleavage/methylation domain-containing protein [Thiothrix subterranea]
MKNNRQRGLSLIELMIAMVVSLVLVAGVSTVYMSSKRAYQARDQLSLMDETARIALNALTKHLEHAGYATSSKRSMDDYFIKPDDVANSKLVSGLCADGKSNISSPSSLRDTANNDTDSVTAYGDTTGVVFIADDDLFLDCANTGGNTNKKDDNNRWEGCRVTTEEPAGPAASTAGALAYNNFFVAPDGTGIPNLNCASSRLTARTPVAQGVENIQFLYGVDTDADGGVNKYLNADGVGTNAGEWQRVISIKVGILVRSLEKVLPAEEEHSYQVLDVLQTRKDRFQRAVYTTVIHLRNVVEG